MVGGELVVTDRKPTRDVHVASIDCSSMTVVWFIHLRHVCPLVRPGVIALYCRCGMRDREERERERERNELAS